jgi:hypothetical protein
MHELIVIERATGQEIGRRSMAPHERYTYYEDCRDHDLLTYEGKYYVLDSVAWRIPEEDLVLGVTFHSHETSCDC